VLEHNRLDLVSLPALVSALEQAFREPGPAGADVHSVARYHLRRGRSAQALALLAGHRARLDARGLLELARLYRRHGEGEAARAIWEQLTARGEPAALSALASHLEHRARDYSGALALARRLPPGQERERRCRRLEALLDH
jgi:hypothetical protein